jgi:hypothetical protein
MNLLSVLFRLNISEVKKSVPDWFLQPFTTYIGDMIYPLIATGFLILIFTVSSKNVIATLAGIIVLWGLYGTTLPFLKAAPLSLMVSVVAAMLVAALITKLFQRPAGE